MSSTTPSPKRSRLARVAIAITVALALLVVVVFAGGYLIYRLYPSLRVFIDGRSDFYGPAFVKAYLDTINAQPGWDRRLEEYGVSRILIPSYIPLGAVLKESKHWRIVSDDGVAILFAKTP